MYIPFLLACISVVYALTNVTVDNTDSAISYVPASSWSGTAVTPLDYGGSHYLSVDSHAVATFTFTGVAVYFISPKWPYAVNTELSVDGSPGEVVDLQDYTPGAPNVNGYETVAYSAVWGKTGLANTQHQLVASMAPGGQYIVVDAFTYTIPDSAGTTSSSSSTSTSGSTSTSSSTSTSDRTNASDSASSPSSSASTHHSNLVAVIAGAICAFLVLMVIAGIILLCWRRRTRDSFHDPSFHDPRHGSSAAGSIGPSNSSFHFSQAGVMSPAPSMLTTNMAGYGAYNQHMPPLPEEHSPPVPAPPFARRPPQVHSAYYPEPAGDPARPGVRNYASDSALGARRPDLAPYDPRALYETDAAPGRLSTVVEGSVSSGSTKNGQAPSYLGAELGYGGRGPADGSTTAFGTRSSAYPSTSGSKGYTGREYYQADQKEYMSDQKTFVSGRSGRSGQSVSPRALDPERVLSPGPPSYDGLS